MLNRLNRNVYEEFLRQFICFSREKKWNSDSIYLFKGNRGNTRTMGEIYSKLTIKTLEHGVLLLTLKRFYIFFQCFYCLRGTIKIRLAKMINVKESFHQNICRQCAMLPSSIGLWRCYKIDFTKYFFLDVLKMQSCGFLMVSGK